MEREPLRIDLKTVDRTNHSTVGRGPLDITLRDRSRFFLSCRLLKISTLMLILWPKLDPHKTGLRLPIENVDEVYMTTHQRARLYAEGYGHALSHDTCYRFRR